MMGIAGPIAVIGWAVGFCYVCGLRGFFALDQSIVFDGARRILGGQTPYLDFSIPWAPMALWVQAAMFALFGVSYRVYVLTAAVLNGIGAMLAYALVRRLIPESRWPALVAGWLTGTWLYSPMGTTYPEQTGFVAVLASVAAVVAGLQSNRAPRRMAWMIAAGISVGIAALCKTNVGLFAIMAVSAVVVLILRRSMREVLGDWLAVGFGIGSVFAGGALWLWTKSDPAAFRHAVFQVAGNEGNKRLLGAGYRSWLEFLTTGKGNDLERIITVTCVVLLMLALIAALSGCERDPSKARRLRVFGVLGLSLVAFQNLFSLSSSHSGTNEVPFVGLVWTFALQAFLIIRDSRREPGEWTGIGKPWIKIIFITALVVTALMWQKHNNLDLLAGTMVGLLIVWFGGWCDRAGPEGAMGTGRERLWVLNTLWVIFLVLGWLGIVVGYERYAQVIFKGKARFVQHESIPALRGLCWAEGLKSGTAHADWTDFEGVVRDLQATQGNFFVVGDYTILYGVVGRPSVGPLLWFHKGLTYPEKYDADLDQRIVQAVDRPDVTGIVVEQITLMNDHTQILHDFPLLQKAISSHYHATKSYGIFVLYRRNGDTK
jgi:4-amino-4-deoxy-L-arabinose transferase-like glycosyltransferase